MAKINHCVLILFLLLSNYSKGQEILPDQKKDLDSILNTATEAFLSYEYQETIKNCGLLINKGTHLKADYYRFVGYDLLGNVYYTTKDSIKARVNLEKGLQIALEIKSDSLIAWSYTNLGSIYSENDKTVTKAIDYFEKSININQRLKNQSQVYLTYINLAWSYLDLNRLEDAFKVLKKANTISESAKISEVNKGFIKFLFGRYYYLKKDLKKAKKYCDEVSEIVDKEDYNDLGKNVYELLINLNLESKNYKEAYTSLEKANFHEEKIAAQEKLEAVEIASAKYNSEVYQKDLEIALKEKKLLDKLIDKSNQIKTIFIIVTIVLLLTLVGFFLLYKSRREYANILKVKNTELLHAKEKAERLTRIKNNFFSTVSHELRTPLYGVIGITSILQEDKELEAHSQNLNSLKFSADYLLALINDVLLLNKMDADALSLEETPFKLNNLIKNITKTFGFTLEQNNNLLSVDIDKNVPNNLIGDSVRLSQILINLIGNAIKFNENGNIWLNIEHVKLTGKGKHRIKFIIRDDGIGIPKEKQATIFDEFIQVENENYSYKGTGLGLPIVKRLLGLYGSKINLISKFGQGSEFSFVIDLTKNENHIDSVSTKGIDDDVLHKNQNNNIHILVVDDNKINQKVTQKILEKHNYISSTANNGEEAIDKIKDFNYSLVLMDINMPKMNGIEATTIIRQFNKDVPIIALTAVELEEMRIKIFNSGMNDIIPKPYDVSQFLSTILRNLNKKPTLN